MTGSLEVVEASVQGWLKTAQKPLVLGICGAQGSGKSTLSDRLAAHLEGEGLKVALLSLDDLYRAPEARPVDISPLFATRGVPGTHDVALGERIFGSLKAGQSTRLPRFDKANDRPFAEENWPEITAPDVVIFEGWCVGARPQADEDLTEPVNHLEHEDDGAWRRAVNDALKGPYADLFRHIDRLILLAAPGFEIVRDWRIEQENALRARLSAEGRTGAKVMSDGEVGRFIQYYERLTRHILQTMPAYADLTLQLDSSRNMKPSPKY
ncbi:kinase [Asticcacaulis taihuensis]|uniref:kinase n=1 Tax=Asticcacaulis taihuensis TaxID=260084 RepID=UPI0026E9E194|nr:kinase [Asticcacaulis taihuensis]